MATSGGVRVTYIGGPTLLIEAGGLRFLTDPTFDPPGGDYTTGPVTLSKVSGPAIEPASLGPINAVLLSHDHHFDNLDHAGRKLLPLASAVFTTHDGAARLGDNAVGLETWQQHELTSSSGPSVRITGTPAQHGPASHDRGPVVGFVLETGAHGPIYISGDTVWFDGIREVIKRFPAIRIAVLFLGAAHVPVVDGHLTFKASEAVDLARALPEATIVPVHFEGWKHFSEGRPAIEKTFADAGLASRIRWLEPGIATTLA
jgi:L-ascorbate metabolism protein UlaG (beta-lactamase superfamily)